MMCAVTRRGGGCGVRATAKGAPPRCCAPVGIIPRKVRFIMREEDNLVNNYPRRARGLSILISRMMGAVNGRLKFLQPKGCQAAKDVPALNPVL